VAVSTPEATLVLAGQEIWVVVVPTSGSRVAVTGTAVERSTPWSAGGSWKEAVSWKDPVPPAEVTCATGLLVAVAVIGPKLAVTDCGAVRLMVCGFVAPLRFPVKPVKAYPALGVAVTVIDVDQEVKLSPPTHSLAGLMAPPGPALVVR